MLGIEHISYALGSEKVDNFALGRHFERDETFIREKIGFTALRRLGAGQSASSLCVDAFMALLAAKTSFEPAACDCLVVVTQNPDNNCALPHLSALVHGLLMPLGLPQSVAAWDIGLGCSGYVYALSMVTAFMEQNGLKNGLIFTADPYSPVLNPEDHGTQLLFGDAAACTLISTHPRFVMGKSLFATDGSQASALCMKNGFVFMDGRSILNFGVRYVTPQILACMEQNSLSPETTDALVLHQATRTIVNLLGERSGFAPEKVPFPLAEIGNCVSSTLPISLALLENMPYKSLVLSGFGVGLSWATTALFQGGQ